MISARRSTRRRSRSWPTCRQHCVSSRTSGFWSCEMDAIAEGRPAPLGLLAELTYRCPLGCPYCSNPLALVPREQELDTAIWDRVFREAAGLGVLHVHLSGGEPAARRDLAALTAAAHGAGLYTNLITSGVGLNETRL